MTARLAPGTRRFAAVDVAACGVALVALVPGVLASVGARPVVFDVIAAVSVVFRRRRPVVVWAVATAAALGASVGAPVMYLVAVAPLFALYTVATACPRTTSRTALLVTGAAALLSAAVSEPGPNRLLSCLLAVAGVAAFWLVGENARVRRAYVAELEVGMARAEADRAAEAERSAARERVRIARELHDVVVHHVSVIAVQAGAARMIAQNSDRDGDQTSTSWSAVEETARLALTELRHLLGALRHDGERPSLAPQPGLGQLDQLIDEVRAAGVPVQLERDDVPERLPPALDLSAYRIVQEALTNVVKHAGMVPTRVRLRRVGQALEIEVTNAAGASTAGVADSGGHGLVGMRERVAVLDGTLHAGPDAGGGFAVRALLPIDGGGR
jgi:signal transduction histidine kinase